MSIALVVVGIGVVRLDALLVERSEEDVAILDDDLLAGRSATCTNGQSNGFVGRVKAAWTSLMIWVQDALERWTERQDDQQVAWTLGIGWACLGGGLAGGCLVFAKAT
jgi:magnesium transporter